MTYDRTFLKRVISAARLTRDRELTCGECWDRLERFAELELAGRDAEALMPLVALHMAICGSCREEYEAFLEALGATTPVSAVTNS